MRIYNEKVLWGTSEVASVTTLTSSDVYELDHIYGYSIQANWVIKSPVTNAKIFLESSNDGVHWMLLQDSSIQITADDSVLYNCTEAFYNKIRLSVSLDSGEIEVSGHINSKGT